MELLLICPGTRAGTRSASSAWRGRSARRSDDRACRSPQRGGDVLDRAGRSPRAAGAPRRRAGRCSQRSGVVPVSARKRRRNERSLTSARGGRSRATVSGASSRSSAHARVGLEAAVGARRAAAGRRTAPGRRCGAARRRSAARPRWRRSAPWSRRTMCRHRSMPAATPARRQDAALVDVEHVRVDLDRRVPRGERGGVVPVRRRAPAVEHAGGGEHERAGADRDDPRRRGAAQRVERRGRRTRPPVVDARARSRCRRAASASRPCVGDERRSPVDVGTGPGRRRRRP